MRLSVEFQTLDQARRRMGASLSSWKKGTGLEKKWESFTVEVTSGEVRSIAPGGPLVHQGQQALLYIKDTRLKLQTLLYDPENSRRFHIAECETLKKMRRDNRFPRYVYTNWSDGVFDVEATDWNTGKVEAVEAKLYVCKNCLDALGLTRERANWPEFSIPDFFRDYETFFFSLPQHTNITAPRGGYLGNWSSITRLYKEGQSWICEECGVNLAREEHQHLLHSHHRNGVTSDSSPKNLQALCVECHDKRPGHGRHPPDKEKLILLSRLRAAQKNN